MLVSTIAPSTTEVGTVGIGIDTFLVVLLLKVSSKLLVLDEKEASTTETGTSGQGKLTVCDCPSKYVTSKSSLLSKDTEEITLELKSVLNLSKFPTLTSLVKSG